MCTEHRKCYVYSTFWLSPSRLGRTPRHQNRCDNPDITSQLSNCLDSVFDLPRWRSQSPFRRKCVGSRPFPERPSPVTCPGPQQPRPRTLVDSPPPPIQILSARKCGRIGRWPSPAGVSAGEEHPPQLQGGGGVRRRRRRRRPWCHHPCDRARLEPERPCCRHSSRAPISARSPSAAFRLLRHLRRLWSPTFWNGMCSRTMWSSWGVDRPDWPPPFDSNNCAPNTIET